MARPWISVGLGHGLGLCGNCDSHERSRHVNYGTKKSKLCRQKYKMLTGSIMFREVEGKGGNRRKGGMGACPAKRCCTERSVQVVASDE